MPTKLPARVRVPQTAAGLSVQVFLRQFLDLQWAPSSLQVLVDGKAPSGPGQRLNPGALVQVQECRPQIPALAPVLFDSPELVVVSKPAGVAVQGGPTSLLDLLSADLGPLTVVHRLDLPVSGVMVLGRGRGGALLDRAFQEGRLAKVYLAAVVVPFSAEELAAGPRLLANPLKWDSLRRRSEVLPEGEEARTLLQPLTPTLALCRLFTGRTHQIRAHLAHAGHPICGDGLYGAGSADRPFWAADRSRRIALHSLLLGLDLPPAPQSFYLLPGEDFLALSGPLPEGLEAAARLLASQVDSF
jgi:23S rRNA-/tRNA-specific pseudouridylate synthase